MPSNTTDVILDQPAGRSRRATTELKVFYMHFILGTQLITRRQCVGESKEHVFQNLGGRREVKPSSHQRPQLAIIGGEGQKGLREEREKRKERNSCQGQE